MSDSPETKRPKGTRWCKTAIALAAIGAVAVPVTFAVARLIGAMPAFMLFTVALIAFAVAILTAGVGLILSKGSAGAASQRLTWGALALAITFFAVARSQQPDMSGTAPIHDVTTDLGNPPFFEAIVPLRADAPNPPEYAGNETAEQQRAAYPDIRTLTLEQPTDEVFAAAEQTAREMGWEIVAADPKSARIEATATTSWFRFKDDVVIRLKPRGVGTDVDVRSKSRIGQGDMGANANRIRAFLGSLSEKTGA